MDPEKRDRSKIGQWKAAEQRLKKALEVRQLLAADRMRKAQGRAKGELRDLGAAALTAAMSDTEFRSKLIAAARGKVLSEQKIVDLALNCTLLSHLEAMPVPSSEPLAAAPTLEPPTRPTITVEVSDSASVIRYTPVQLQTMSDKDLHEPILTVFGSSYIDEIGRWACSHPAFLEAMKSISRDVDRRIDGLQPDMASRYLMTVRLEEDFDTHSNLKCLEALVEWEDIARSDHWIPETPQPKYTFTHIPQGDTQSTPRIFNRPKDIIEAETEGEYRNGIEYWNGTWNRDGRTVPVTEVQQAMVFAIWGERVTEAKARTDKGESARDDLDRLRQKLRDAQQLEEEKQTVKGAMKARRTKYGDNN